MTQKVPVFILDTQVGDYLIHRRNSTLFWSVTYLPENRRLGVHFNKILNNEAPVPRAERYVVRHNNDDNE